MIAIDSAAAVLRVVQDRGLKVVILPGPPTMPVLRVPRGVDPALASPALLATLRAWRLEIIDLLTQEEVPCPK